MFKPDTGSQDLISGLTFFTGCIMDNWHDICYDNISEFIRVRLIKNLALGDACLS